MSHHGGGQSYRNNYHKRRALQNGAQNGGPFPVDNTSDLDDNNSNIRFPDIDRDPRERRSVKRDAKLNSRIPLPARSNEINAGRDSNYGEPRGRRNFNSSAPEYPIPGPEPQTGRDQRKSRVNAVKRVTFYRNGDKHFKGVEMVVTKQRYRSFDTIVEDLSKAIPLPYGVRTVFSPGGSTVESMSQLEDGRYYICSSGDQLIKNVDYGKKPKDKEKPRRLDGESSSEASSISTGSSRDSRFGGSNGNTKPRVVTVISENDKNKKCKLLLNRKTVKSYEDVLKDISDMLKFTVRELRTVDGDTVSIPNL